jgi:precorrin-3B methylase
MKYLRYIQKTKESLEIYNMHNQPQIVRHQVNKTINGRRNTVISSMDAPKYHMVTATVFTGAKKTSETPITIHRSIVHRQNRQARDERQRAVKSMLLSSVKKVKENSGT